MFHAVLEDIKNHGRTTESMSVKSCGSNIYLHLLIIRSTKNGSQERVCIWWGFWYSWWIR